MSSVTRLLMEAREYRGLAVAICENFRRQFTAQNATEHTRCWFVLHCLHFGLMSVSYNRVMCLANIKADNRVKPMFLRLHSFHQPSVCYWQKGGSIDTANQLSCLSAQNHALFRISDVTTPAYEADRVGFAHRIVRPKNQTVGSYDLDQSAQHAWIKEAGVIVNVSKILARLPSDVLHTLRRVFYVTVEPAHVVWKITTTVRNDDLEFGKAFQDAFINYGNHELRLF